MLIIFTIINFKFLHIHTYMFFVISRASSKLAAKLSGVSRE